MSMGLRPVVDDYLAGRREAAVAGYAHWLPLINFENRQCGLLAAKALATRAVQPK